MSNVTTFLEAPLLMVWRDSVLVMVHGVVGALEASVALEVYGLFSMTYYTVPTVLVLPNGTAIPLKVDWQS